MKKFNKNKFEINAKSFSLTKLNPYYLDKTHYLPYRYKDPSFKIKYNGPLMQKDLYLLNLMNNHFNISSDKYTLKTKQDLPLINSNPIEISSKKDIIFDLTDYYKNQKSDEFTKYSFDKLKKKFFFINPVLLKKQLIDYRKSKFEGTPTYQNKVKYNSKTFLINFQKQVNENNFLNWERIKKIHLLKEMKLGSSLEKYHDNDKIYEILGIKNPNKNYSPSKKHRSTKMTLIQSKLKKLEGSNVYSPSKRRKYSVTSF